MLTATISFFAGAFLAMFIFAILSANHGNTPNDYQALLEMGLDTERKEHQSDVDRVKRYHRVIIHEKECQIHNLRQRNIRLEEKLRAAGVYDLEEEYQNSLTKKAVL